MGKLSVVFVTAITFGTTSRAYSGSDFVFTRYI